MSTTHPSQKPRTTNLQKKCHALTVTNNSTEVSFFFLFEKSKVHIVEYIPSSLQTGADSLTGPLRG
jgi:hypothetical protein